MTRIYFVRHGKTIWNLERRFQGKNGNSELVDQSFEDAHKVADYFNVNNISFDVSISSTLPRAKDTLGEILFNLTQRPAHEVDQNVLEIDFGKWEGRKIEDIQKEYPKLFLEYRQNTEQYDKDVFGEIGGERFKDVQERFIYFADEIGKRFPKGNILVVSHGAALMTGINGILGVPVKDIRKRGYLENTSISIIEKENDTYKLIKWNGVDHLGIR